ncbi:signal peptide peptidase SppA [Sinomicrobium weinanense]|uniref:Signal peptide peptidase SppA n=1 Tax=Sinomicrobium weinanense TaxID=2842200 RepID=A0A926JPM5_9FLAO|nr:signal peptide peptidase SppA [Sinomicrobium weinanense]MBC9795014.1 signal peptide peptidase SppA [Sinomicrobium weinanense]MBU3125125.1 signal peptide peptidase SppA [Sinomicrobium weinanense]
MKFLRNLLASILGCLVAFGVLFFMLLIFVALAGSQEKTITVSSNSILEIRIDEPLKDYGGRFDFTDFGIKFEKYDGLNHILEAIKKAKTDDNIKGISIRSNYLPAGMAQVRAIREAIQDFKTSGKFVYAYGDFYSQKNYYLASVADSVFVNPVGDIDFKGLASEVLFFKDLQEKSGVKFEVIRHGKYKSAVEPFLDNKMSPENREQISELLHSVWGTMLEDIAANRGVQADALNVIADNLEARTPPKALEARLVDRIAYVDEYETSLKKAGGLAEDEELKYIRTEEYAEHVARKNKKAGKNRIAVIYAEGDIVYGEGNKDYVGQGIITKALKEAREDDKVRAIVLRINSPGGSALASDIIWREVEITKKEKPVVVSMGNLAASGGYYIAAGADRIFAEPNTITGSIGVFGMLPNFKQLADRWGINAEQVVTNKQAQGYSVFEPLSDEYREVTKEGIENIYNTFIGHVAKGREMDVDEVDSIAQGRVWSGREALEIGLVDEIGGLGDAVKYAAETVGAKEYTVENYPVYTTSMDEIVDKFIGVSVRQSKEHMLKEEIGEEAYRILQKIKVLSQQKGVQARLPFELIVR